MIAWISKLLSGGVLGQITKGVSDHLDHKRKLKAAKVESELKLIEAKTLSTITRLDKDQDFVQDWDLQAMKNQDTSWKDEAILVLFSIPFILAFCGNWGAEVVTAGLEAISKFPDWLVAGWGIIVSASYGFRQYGNWMMNKTTKGKNE